MRIIVQRVDNASVSVEWKIVWQIKKWLLLFVGIGQNDGENDIEKMVKKIINLRIFQDENQKMNLSVSDIDGQILSISQFTLFADCKKWNRPSFTNSANPEFAKNLWDFFNKKLGEYIKVETGIFGADMKIDLLNNWPVTIFLDSENL